MTNLVMKKGGQAGGTRLPSTATPARTGRRVVAVNWTVLRELMNVCFSHKYTVPNQIDHI